MLRQLSRIAMASTLLGAVVVQSPGCAGASESRRRDADRPIEPLKQHSVQTPQLEALMKVIAMTAAERTPRTLPSDVESTQPTREDLDKSYQQAIVLADALVTAAGRIPFAVEGKTVPPETLRGFLDEAQILKNSAEELRSNAQQRRGEAMSRSLDRINATCITCHSKYRDLSGAMDFPRVEGEALQRTRTAAAAGGQ